MTTAYSYRTDPKVPPFPDDRAIVIFDGKCVLCSGFARFIVRRDRRRRLRLLAAQTPLGTALYGHFGLATDNYETNVLLDGGRTWLKSEGSIRIFELLGFPWSLAGVGRVLPRPWRDRIYGYIAARRLKWFGARDTCFLPEPADADRFLA